MAIVTKQRKEEEKGAGNQNGIIKIKKEENRTVIVTLRNGRLEEKRKKVEVKWSKAIKEIEGMKVRDRENKIMEGGREIEKGTPGSKSKSV